MHAVESEATFLRRFYLARLTSVWNWCKQGMIRTRSPGLKGYRQMEQLFGLTTLSGAGSLSKAAAKGQRPNQIR